MSWYCVRILCSWTGFRDECSAHKAFQLIYRQKHTHKMSSAWGFVLVGNASSSFINSCAPDTHHNREAKSITTFNADFNTQNLCKQHPSTPVFPALPVKAVVGAWPGCSLRYRTWQRISVRDDYAPPL